MPVPAVCQMVIVAAGVTTIAIATMTMVWIAWVTW